MDLQPRRSRRKSSAKHKASVGSDDSLSRAAPFLRPPPSSAPAQRIHPRIQMEVSSYYQDYLAASQSRGSAQKQRCSNIRRSMFDASPGSTCLLENAASSSDLEHLGSSDDAEDSSDSRLQALMPANSSRKRSITNGAVLRAHSLLPRLGYSPAHSVDAAPPMPQIRFIPQSDPNLGCGRVVQRRPNTADGSRPSTKQPVNGAATNRSVVRPRRSAGRITFQKLTANTAAQTSASSFSPVSPDSAPPPLTPISTTVSRMAGAAAADRRRLGHKSTPAVFTLTKKRRFPATRVDAFALASAESAASSAEFSAESDDAATGETELLVITNAIKTKFGALPLPPLPSVASSAPSTSATSSTLTNAREYESHRSQCPDVLIINNELDVLSPPREVPMALGTYRARADTISMLFSPASFDSSHSFMKAEITSAGGNSPEAVPNSTPSHEYTSLLTRALWTTTQQGVRTKGRGGRPVAMIPIPEDFSSCRSSIDDGSCGDAASIGSHSTGSKAPQTRTSKKLASFFGETPTADICVREIEHGGLKMLMKSRLPLCYFLRFLLDEYSSENLFSWFEVQHYQLFHFRNAKERRDAAVQLIDVFIKPSAPLEVNLTAKCRSPIIDLVENHSTDPITLQHCFLPAADAIHQLLDDSYQRFEHAHWFKLMREELGGGNVFGESERRRAVKWLQVYLARSSAGEISNAIQRRNAGVVADQEHFGLGSRRRTPVEVLTCELVAEFCRVMFGLEMERVMLEDDAVGATDQHAAKRSNARLPSASLMGFSGRSKDVSDSPGLPRRSLTQKQSHREGQLERGRIASESGVHNDRRPTVTVGPSRRMVHRRASSVEIVSPTRLFAASNGSGSGIASPSISGILNQSVIEERSSAPLRKATTISRGRGGKHLKLLGVESDSELYANADNHDRLGPSGLGCMVKLQKSFEAMLTGNGRK